VSGYIKTKSKSLLEKGIEQYRQEDFFKHPPRSLSDKEQRNLLNTAQQIHDGCGFEKDKPIVDIDLNHVIILVQCFHFSVGRIVSRLEGDIWKDVIPVKHIVSDFVATVYLQSGVETERSRRTRRIGIFQQIGPDYLAPLQYQPRLISSQKVETGKIGEYRYDLNTECQSQGNIQYKHVLFLYALDIDRPCLAITAEHSAYDPGVLLLCVFQGRGHKNLGSLHQIDLLQDFKERAMEVAKGIIRVDD